MACTTFDGYTTTYRKEVDEAANEELACIFEDTIYLYTAAADENEVGDGQWMSEFFLPGNFVGCAHSSSLKFHLSCK